MTVHMLKGEDGEMGVHIQDCRAWFCTEIIATQYSWTHILNRSIIISWRFLGPFLHDALSGGLHITYTLLTLLQKTMEIEQ